MDRLAVFSAINSEREYQKLAWGSRSCTCTGNKLEETPKSIGEFLVYMQHHLNKAVAFAATQPRDEKCLDAMREVVALGVACFEQHGVPPRECNYPVINKRDGQPATLKP